MTNPVKVVSMFARPDVKSGSIVVNTTSSAKTSWETDLSPFYLGPCSLYGIHVAKRMENAWQFTKVYKDHVDTTGNPTEAYWTWALAGWNDTYAHRYPHGRGAKPLYSLWNGEKLGYVEARKKIYVPLYASAVIKTDGFKHLTEIYSKNSEITLRDFDGYDYLSLGKSLKDVLNDPGRKMGHAFVLAGLLTKDPSIMELLNDETK